MVLSFRWAKKRTERRVDLESGPSSKWAKVQNYVVPMSTFVGARHMQEISCACSMIFKLLGWRCRTANSKYTRRNPLTVSIPCCLTFVHIRFRFRLQYTCVVVTLRSSPLSLNLYECVLCVPCGFDNTNPYLHISEPTCAVTTSSRASNTTDFLTSHATAVIATSSRSENMKPYSSEEGYPPTQQPPVTYRPPNSAPDSSPLPSYPPPNYAPSAGFHIPPGPYPPNPVPQDPYGRGHVPQSYPPPNLMPRPVVPNCPPGLEYLTQINQLLVKQKKELFEIITDIEVANRYVILNTMGQTVFNCNEGTIKTANLANSLAWWIKPFGYERQINSTTRGVFTRSAS
ncbi:hypothetical protein CRM22_004675 [Opisthorchis felineus]|uniref:Phospholipid scramblase n=1 Tax=Opisthorchis felineus TaxID=147828 RepID=A0A4S2LV05_OPIFE|nr:hypothetical protein CRM22_004675 [Opisthorchis felineus]